MFIQAILLGGGLAAYVKRHNKDNAKGVGQTSHKNIKFSGKTLFKDFKTSILGDERQQLQLTLNPDMQGDIEKYKKEANRNLVLSIGATGLALLASVSPLFTVLGILDFGHTTPTSSHLKAKIIQQPTISCLFLLFFPLNTID